MKTTTAEILASMKNPCVKIPTSMFALAILVAGISNAASQTTVVIDRDFNSGNNIAEYSAWDTSNPFDGSADFGSGNFASGTSVGPSLDGTQLRRNAFFFEIPTGYTTAQINEATLRIRLNTKSNPTTDLSMYWAALDTLGTQNAAYAISTFSSASFTDTGLGLATNAATATTYTFDITSLVREALDLNLSTTVVAFRFQMDDDISLEYGTQNNYNLLGFASATVANRPALTFKTLNFDVSEDTTKTESSVLSGVGALTKTGAGTLTLSGANAYTGGTFLTAGWLVAGTTNAFGTGSITQSSGTTLQINTTGTVTNAMSIYNIQTLQTVTLSGNKTLNNATYTVEADTTTTESGNLTGDGGITKEGAGTLLVTGDNNYTGAVAVNAGVLELASTVGGAAAATSSVSVAGGAILLISQSHQVNDTATVSLSGGTIQRASGVSEVFGNLSVSSASFLDFGSGTTGTLSFGTYTASALLTVNNFFQGNVLTFGTDLSGSINNTNSFQFDNAFTSSWNQGTFTITAIPEPSTCVAAAGLLGLLVLSLRSCAASRTMRE